MFSAVRYGSILCRKSPGVYCYRSVPRQTWKGPAKVKTEKPVLSQKVRPKVAEVEKLIENYVPPFVNRSKSEIWKPLAFAFGVKKPKMFFRFPEFFSNLFIFLKFSGCCYVGASIWHYERHRSLKDFLYNSKRWGYEKKEKFGEFRQQVNNFPFYWSV